MKTKDAIQHFDTGIALAEALRIHPQAVYQWGERVPEMRAMQLDRLTGGTLKYREKDYRGGASA